MLFTSNMLTSSIVSLRIKCLQIIGLLLVTQSIIVIFLTFDVLLYQRLFIIT